MSLETENTLPLGEKESSVPSSLHDDPKASKTREYLLCILALQWSICIASLVTGIYSVFIDDAIDNSRDAQSLIPLIVMTAYYTFGLLMAYLLSQVGLLIFASIGVVLFIIGSIFLGYVALAVLTLGIGFGVTTQVYEFVVFIVILFAIIATVAILTLKLCFNLAKAIRTHEYIQV